MCLSLRWRHMYGACKTADGRSKNICIQRAEDEQQLEAEVEQHRQMLERRDIEAKHSKYLYVHAWPFPNIHWFS